MKWPYENELGTREIVQYDVVILGGGISGCLAAISAKNKGLSVAIIEKGSIGKREEKTIYNSVLNPNKYIENLLQIYGEELINKIEKMGFKSNDEINLNIHEQLKSRILSDNFKPILVRQLRILGIKIYDRVEVCDLLINEIDRKKVCCGAIGMHTRTAKTIVFKAKSIVLAMSKPSRIFNFNLDIPALSENCAFQCVGSGLAIGIRNGLEIEFKNLKEFGIKHDQDLKTNIDNVYVCGKQLMGCDDVLSCVSGYYVGGKAADNALISNFIEYDTNQLIQEEKRIFAPLYNVGNMSWILLNHQIKECMCKYSKTDVTLGLSLLSQIESKFINQVTCDNPHELVRIHEVFDILEISKMLLEKMEENHE